MFTSIFTETDDQLCSTEYRIISVSYTHLDVYKRQVLHLLIPVTDVCTYTLISAFYVKFV